MKLFGRKPRYAPMSLAPSASQLAEPSPTMPAASTTASLSALTGAGAAASVRGGDRASASAGDRVGTRAKPNAGAGARADVTSTHAGTATATASLPTVTPASSPLRIDSRDALARLSPAFRKALRAEFDIGTLVNKLCPVEFDDGSVAILTVEEYADSEHIEEIERMVRRASRPLAQASRIVVPATLLLSIAREQITGDTLRNRRRVLLDPLKSSMAAAFHDIVAWGVQHGASDLHINIRLLEPESEIKYTVGGKYVTPYRFQRMQTATLMEVLAVAYMDIQGGNGAVFDPAIEQQGRILHEVDHRGYMLRWASLAADCGPSVTMRILHLDAEMRLEGFASLGYLPSQIALIDRALLSEGGAVVLAGVVGSGKSTTIATMMSMVPTTRKVITLEDPVEYLIPHALQNTVTRTLDGGGSGEFDAKLKTIKRSAMNDLLIGEIRDHETGRAFMDLASSGSNLYTTTHAGSAILIPDRLASDFIGISRDLLATPGILKLLVYQTLLPTLCSHCRLPFASLRDAHWRRYTERLVQLYDVDPEALRIRNPDGCSHCRTELLPELNGISGRTVVAEMIEPITDETVLRLIRKGDALGLRAHFLSHRTASFVDADMTGKTAMECAVYKASIGDVDPRDIEPRFMSFETVALQRQSRLRRAAAQAPVRRRPITAFSARLDATVAGRAAGRVVQGNVAKGRVAQSRVVQGHVAHDGVAQGHVAQSRIVQVGVAAGRLAGGVEPAVGVQT